MCCVLGVCALGLVCFGCSAGAHKHKPAASPKAPPPAAKTPPKPSKPVTCKSSVHGHVVDARSHEPVAGATVIADGEAATITNEQGRFSLRYRCPGNLTIGVERDDYKPSKRTFVLGRSASLEIEMEAKGGEVIVVTSKAPRAPETRSAAVLSGDALERTRGRSFSDALSEVAGVSQLRSATGMAKPIVRGQFGRRLMMLVDDVRHRSQDWGLDHAPEIDPFVADRITVVRGAAGVQFGPDAIGGAILVDPPSLPRQGISGELHAIGMPNQKGGSLATRLQGASKALRGFAWQAEGSVKLLAGARTPNYALDNTGGREWNTGLTLGYRRGDSEYTLSYRHYSAKLGICSCLRMESSEDFFAQLQLDEPVDSDLYESRHDIVRPFQQVDHDLAIARARWKLPAGRIKATYAFQFDNRREFDQVRTATGPQFSFRLFTHDADVNLEHKPFHLTDHLHMRGRVGVTGMAQVHSYSGLTLIPDYDGWSGGVYGIERLIGDDYELEAGLRYDVTKRTASLIRRDFLRLVRSDQIAMDACTDPDADTVDCGSTFHALSATVGARFQLTSSLLTKFNLATASRAPNPDEQYLNGTSPSFPVLGLGKPDLGTETTYSASVTTELTTDRIRAEASAYANYIGDYIYFSPAIDDDGDPIFDVLVRGSFPRFVTKPVDAVFYGVDASVAAKLTRSLTLGGQLSAVRARNTTDDTFLVFVPPDRARASATYTNLDALGRRRGYLSLAGTFVRRQNRFDINADLAAPPDAYFLVDAEVGAETRINDQKVKLAIAGTNLLNTRYRDYTSLLRYFADQPGWQLMVRLSFNYTNDKN